MPAPPYSITYKPSVAEALCKLDRQYQRALITAIEALAQEPRPDGVKKLQGGGGEYRLRVGSYRVAYDISDRELVILVLHLGHRKEVYRHLRRPAEGKMVTFCFARQVDPWFGICALPLRE